MKATKPTCTILISLGVFVMPMLGQLDRGVIVSHAGSEIRISIARTTPLGTVLEEVCREASAQCLGTPQAMAAMVPAQEVRGDWRHVISILLGGAGFNYIASAPSGASPGMLQIVGAASQGRPEQSEVRSTTAARQPNQTGNAESSSEREAASAGAVSASSSTPLTSGAGESGYSQPSGAAEQATMGGQPGRLLFSDGYGNPIPVSHQNLEFLLFPDAGGTLIPVASQGSASYSLFPDSKGNPIPASNQALPYLLFPDGNGRLVPAQRGGH
ncbi:MAG: hypothetical protein ACHP8B_11970 [Terriglobales bacterium]